MKTTTATTYGTLHSYETAEHIRPATREEMIASIAAALAGTGAGVIVVDGMACYVESAADVTMEQIETLRDEAGAAGDTEQAWMAARALKDHDESAIRICVRAILDARAMESA